MVFCPNFLYMAKLSISLWDIICSRLFDVSHVIEHRQVDAHKY